MKRIIFTLTLIFYVLSGNAQISVKKTTSVIGSNWSRPNGQIVLFKSTEAENNYFFTFSNAIYPTIDDPRKIVFSATKDELNLLYKTSLNCLKNGEAVTLKLGEYDLNLTYDKDLLKKSDITFLFSKEGETDCTFQVNKKQLKSLFGNKDGKLRGAY